MSPRLKTLLQIIIGVLLAAGLLYYVYRDNTWSQMADDMRQADPFWLSMGGLNLLAVFAFRTLRWQMMLHSSGYPVRMFTTSLSVLILYMINSVTPKVGEVVRCTVLYKTDKVPVSASLGTVFTERVIDVLVLLGGVSIIFLMEIGRLGKLFQQIFDNLSAVLGEHGLVIAALAVAVLIGGGLGLLWFIRKRNKSNDEAANFSGKLRKFIRQMIIGAKSIFLLEKPWLFLLYTALIWVSLILMNYFYILALPDTADLGIYIAFLILFIGGIGWVFPVPGGMGTTHFIIAQMFLAFDLNETAGENIALLSNAATNIFSVVFGLIALGLLFYFVLKQRTGLVEDSV